MVQKSAIAIVEGLNKIIVFETYDFYISSKKTMLSEQDQKINSLKFVIWKQYYYS